MAKIINGNDLAKSIRDEIKLKVERMKKETGFVPRLDVVLVGDDPGSQVYVRNKEKDCAEVGMRSETHRIPADIKGERLFSLVKSLNEEKSVSGIIVQLPLPDGLDEGAATNSISPLKDVDGLHLENVGKLFKGEEPFFFPCTPSGVMEMLLSTGIDLQGKEAVVVGRSNIVGKPMAMLLLSKNSTVTICHSRTRDLPAVCRRADILVAAVGRSKMIKGDWVKPGAVVIDVGMNREEKGLTGDVDFNEVSQVAGYITPVPGGVGPMTRAMLVRNTFIAAERSLKRR